MSCHHIVVSSFSSQRHRTPDEACSFVRKALQAAGVVSPTASYVSNYAEDIVRARSEGHRAGFAEAIETYSSPAGGDMCIGPLGTTVEDAMRRYDQSHPSI